jgi:hypothetical protein
MGLYATEPQRPVARKHDALCDMADELFWTIYKSLEKHFPGIIALNIFTHKRVL